MELGFLPAPHPGNPGAIYRGIRICLRFGVSHGGFRRSQSGTWEWVDGSHFTQAEPTEPCQLPHNNDLPGARKQPLLLGSRETGGRCRTTPTGKYQVCFQTTGTGSGVGYPQETSVCRGDNKRGKHSDRDSVVSVVAASAELVTEFTHTHPPIPSF